MPQANHGARGFEAVFHALEDEPAKAGLRETGMTLRELRDANKCCHIPLRIKRYGVNCVLRFYFRGAENSLFLRISAALLQNIPHTGLAPLI